jgi:hypothetical protein
MVNYWVCQKGVPRGTHLEGTTAELWVENWDMPLKAQQMDMQQVEQTEPQTAALPGNPSVHQQAWWRG